MRFKRLCATLSMLAMGLSASAQDPLHRDQDFQFQGEYLGNVSLLPGSRETIGLQVVARGGGKFVAVLYRGGLPGAGWKGDGRTALSGQLQDNVLSLTGANHKVEIKGGFDGKHSFAGGSEGHIWKLKHNYTSSITYCV